MHARSALFDLYGDHLLRRDGWAPVSAIVGLLSALGISAPATRTAISRMVSEEWLVPQARGQRGYAVTDRARSRLAEAGARIYRIEEPPWDGSWHVVVLPQVADRSTRARLARSLGYLGYGQLAPRMWVAPRRSPELAGAIEEVRATATLMEAAPDGTDEALVRQVWDLDGLAAAYDDFLTDLSTNGRPADDEAAFVERTELVHRWRLFLFRDPGLPSRVLPADWVGHRAARAFDARAARLRDEADAFVDRWLAGGRDAT